MTRPRVVFVHGSVGNAAATWSAQRALADRFDLVLHTRSGYPPRAPVARIDFEEQADELAAELREGDHLVGHSYGGVVSLLAAARGPVVASLTVNEPPAFGVVPDDPAVRTFVTRYLEYLAAGPHSPEEYVRVFLPLVGATLPPGRLSPTLEQGAAAALVERPPNEAVIPLEALAAGSFPKLVVSGAHHPAFDAVCDALEVRLPAERAVVSGAGHSIPRASAYNDVLAEFVERAAG